MKKGERKFKESQFVEALTDQPQPTSSIAKKVGCSWDTARIVLNVLFENGKIDRILIDAGTGTGEQSLWLKKKSIEENVTEKVTQKQIKKEEITTKKDRFDIWMDFFNHQKNKN